MLLCEKEWKKKAKQPDPVTAYRPGERSVSSVNRSSTTERPHKSPRLLTSPSIGKQYCDNGAAAAGSLGAVGTGSAQFGPMTNAQPQLWSVDILHKI